MSRSPQNGGSHCSTGGNPRDFAAVNDAARLSAEGVTVFCPLISFAISLKRDTLTTEHYKSSESIVMTDAEDMVAEIEALGEKLRLARESITKRFIGQERVVELTPSALLCGGHGLLI